MTIYLESQRNTLLSLALYHHLDTESRNFNLGIVYLNRAEILIL